MASSREWEEPTTFEGESLSPAPVFLLGCSRSGQHLLSGWLLAEFWARRQAVAQFLAVHPGISSLEMGVCL